MSSLNKDRLKEDLIARPDNAHPQLWPIELIAQTWIAPTIRLVVEITCDTCGKIQNLERKKLAIFE